MFTVEDHGSIVLVRPLTPDVTTWLQENTDDEAQWFGAALVCEPRYVAPLVAELIEQGFAAQ
jgi:hypothetical protein